MARQTPDARAWLEERHEHKTVPSATSCNPGHCGCGVQKLLNAVIVLVEMRYWIAVFLTSGGLLAQTQARFEATEITPSGPVLNPYTLMSGGVLRGERYDLRKATMLELISLAYKVDQGVVIGGPNWLEFDRFDVSAKAPAGTPPDTVRLMLRSLLADRFGLAIHDDERPMPVYALDAGKAAGKMQASDGAESSGCRFVPQPKNPALSAYACRNVTMQEFALQLRNLANDYLVEPVVDATGLDGRWDLDLKWHRRSQVLPAGERRITIFEAIETQTGLKLALRVAPSPVLVIDHVNHQPTPNAPDVAKKLPPLYEEFEVADLKLAKEGPGGLLRQTPGGGFEANAASLAALVPFAWDIDTSKTNERFVGLPKGYDSVRVTVHGRTATNTNSDPPQGQVWVADDVRAMLRNLLVERFQIKWHYENRVVDAYSLVSSGKSRLKTADPENRASCHEARSMRNDPRDSNPMLAELISCRNVTVAQFAAKLYEIYDDFAFPLEDATGISGTWDFDLSFTPGWLIRRQTATSGANDSDPNGAVPFDEAISKQLGLKLEKRKRLLPIVVIEHMELQPKEN